MKGKTVRFVAIGAAALALCLIVAAPAFASVHVTTALAQSDTLSASLVSTGDAGFNHGNMNNTTSPILPAPASSFGGWFNQNVTFGNLAITDPDFDGDVILGASFWQFSSDGVNWTPNTQFFGSKEVATEGLYGLTAVGTDDTETADVATGTIIPAFGIDKTKPDSTSDVKPVYNQTAVVTITATDTLSGIENLQYSVSSTGPFNYANDADPGSAFAVPVTFGVGSQTLRWHAFDNAGNIDGHSVNFIVRPLGFVPKVTLNTSVSGKDKHNVTFSGTIDPLATSSTLNVTIRRWKNKKWNKYASFQLTIPAYAGSYSVQKRITSDGTFSASGTDSGGSSPWSQFKTH